MPIYRVNTPGPSFTVEADNLEQATSKAVTRGLPVRFEDGHVVTQNTVIGPHPRSQELRYVQVYMPEHGMDFPYTGFVVYLEEWEPPDDSATPAGIAPDGLGGR